MSQKAKFWRSLRSFLHLFMIELSLNVYSNSFKLQRNGKMEKKKKKISNSLKFDRYLYEISYETFTGVRAEEEKEEGMRRENKRGMMENP